MYNGYMVKAIIFDCFGVLLTDALSILCGELEARDPDKMHELRAIIHAANRGIISPEVSTRRAAELLDFSVDEYRQRIHEGEVRNTELLEYIKLLRNDYKTAMLSNVTVQGIERRFPDGELSNYFDELVISSAVGFAKPDAEIYQITAERLGLRPDECVFTDDRADYVVAAQQVGMQAIVFESFARFKLDLTEVLAKA